LEAANRELETFSYSVSHDLRAPLRLISAYSHAIAIPDASGPPGGAQELAGRIYVASRRMNELIDDLMTLATIARGALSRDFVDLSRIARSVELTLREREPDRRIHLVVEDGIEAWADYRFARLVLEHLLGNAWKFTARKGEAQVSFTRSTTIPGSFVVKDNGAGLDMTYVSRLFEPFQRLHRTDEFPGTGIGLATVRRAIQRHGGSISIEGAVGVGAAVTFCFGAAEEARSRGANGNLPNADDETQLIG
jgi:light-regulated signal transduction histidine kinase (bacteriophytochrome)